MAKTQSAIRSGVGMNALFKNKPELKPVPDQAPEEEMEVPVPTEPDPEPAPPEPEPVPAVAGSDPLEVLDRVRAADPESAAARRPRRRRSHSPTVRSEVQLPEEVMGRVKTQLRPARTGAPRTLACPLLLQGYIRAIDELGLDVDLEGIEAGMEDEVTERVRTALELWAAR